MTKTTEGGMYRATLLMGEVKRAMVQIRERRPEDGIRIPSSIFLDRMARLDRFPKSIIRNAGIAYDYTDAVDFRAANPDIRMEAALGIDLEYLHFPALPDPNKPDDECRRLGYIEDALVVANLLPWIPKELKSLVYDALLHAHVNIKSEPEAALAAGAQNLAADRVSYEFAKPDEMGVPFDELLHDLLTLKEWAEELKVECGSPTEEDIQVFNRILAEHEAKEAKRRGLLN